MGEEIESLYALLGIKPDEASAADAVSKLVKVVQSKLKSSVYGGKDGVITLPATLEGKFKNGKEINQDIKDAYAAIYNTAKKMADESVSLTLKDIENFKAQIDKFGKKTAKYRGSDVIANANNNLRQTLSDYQTFVNDLRKEVSVQQKVRTKQAQKAKAQAKAKTRKSNYSDISDEEINANIKNEQYRGTRLTGPKGFKRNSGFDKGVATSRTVMATEYGGSYEIKGASGAAKRKREAEKESAKTLKTTVNKELANALADVAEKHGGNKNVLTEQQKALEKANLAANEAAKHLGDLEHGRSDSSKKEYDTFIGAVSNYIKQAGKSDWDTMNLTTNKTMHRYHNSDGTLGIGNDTIKGEGKNHAEANKALKGTMKTYKDIIKNGDAMAMEEARVRKVLARLGDWKGLEALNKSGLSAISNTKKKTIGATDNSQLINEVRNMQSSLSNVTKKINDVTNAVTDTTKAVTNTTNATQRVVNATETQTNYDKIENSAERVADSAEAKKNQDIISDLDTDLGTGFNTDAKANELIKALSGFENLKDMMCPCETVLQAILTEVQSISKNGINVKGDINKKQEKKARDNTVYNAIQKVLEPVSQLALPSGKPVPILGTQKNYYEGKDIYQEQKARRILEEDSKRTGIDDISRSTVTTTKKDPHSWITKFIDSIEELTGVTDNYRVIMAKTSEEQDELSARRVSTYGLNRGRFPAESGDKISFARSMSLWRGRDKFGDLFKDVNLSEGIKVDTTEITDKLAKVLSGAEMFKAQTGGWMNNLIAAGTGGLAFTWQPSLEKSRAQAEGINQIMANIREAANDVLQDIQLKESTLSGMQKTGDLKFNIDGSIDLERSTTEAKTLVLQLEESKQVLASILGDVGAVDQVVDKTGGKLNKIIKRLGFASPVLRQNNNILANLNAGLDKSGKALKFQTRMGEILNYAFQLMSRHIGQVLKNLLMMINPISLLKKAFSDFASYDVKWQRTMNVIKYNLRRIIRPFMEWFAQQLVNVLGIVNAIIKGIGQAFGKDWDLFDQTAANAEKTREEFEKINNVTASFDELHDISGESGGNTAENDLLGDIYKPEWGDLYDTITAKAKKLAEVLIPIFTTIGNIFKWVLKHWKALVAAWAAFKIAKALWNLLNWAGLLKDAFGAIGLAGFGKLLSVLSIIAGVILTIKTLIDEINWSNDFFAMNPDERRKQGDKNIKQGELGGAFLGAGIGGLVGGPVGAAIGAVLGDGIAETAWATFNTAVSYWRGDSESIKHFSKEMGEGIGKTSGVVAGALIGASLGGPAGAVIGAGIGWAIGSPLGKALGSAIGDGLNSLQNITRGIGDFQKLRVTAEDVEDAFRNVNEKTKVYNEQLDKLKNLEKETGENGKKLYDMVESGAQSYWGLNDAQKAVYDQYKAVIEAEKEMKTAKQQSFEVSAKNAEQLGKESQNFKDYLTILQDGVKQGVISQDDMYGHLAQTYGSLSANMKEIFVNQLPAYMRESIEKQGTEYETFGNKTAKFFKDWGNRIINDHISLWTSIKDGWNESGLHGAVKGAFEGIDTWFAKSSNSLKIFKATEDDVAESTKNLTEAQERQNELQRQVDELQIQTKSNAEQLYNQLNSGKITYEDLTTEQQTLVNKYGELREAMKTTDKAALINAETIASIDYQAAKTSGNYDTFIENLKSANERGEISTEQMENIMAQAYSDLDRKSRESFENQAKEHGVMVENIRTKSNEYLGIMGIVKKNVGNAWTDLKTNVTTKAKETWQNVIDRFSNLRDTLAKKWNEIREGASKGWQNIKKAITDWIKSLWTSITDMFNGVVKMATDTWEKVKNFFSGKGFKTNEQVDNNGTKNVSIATYAVGTNYVPSDRTSLFT